MKATRVKAKKMRSLDGHPRAAETRAAMLAAHFEDEVEVMDLQASELACAVADAWMAWRSVDVGPVAEQRAEIFGKAVSRLEKVTRPSAMRKVRP